MTDSSRATYNREYQRERRRRLRDLPKPDHVHGVNGYSNYLCRCDVCRAAVADAARRRRVPRRVARVASMAAALGYALVPAGREAEA